MVLLVAFALGVLVTYAEPAVAAIRPLATLVDPQSAPYLYFILNQQQEITVRGHVHVHVYVHVHVRVLVRQRKATP